MDAYFWIALIAVVAIAGLVFGVVVGKRDLFPIRFYRAVRNLLRPPASALNFKIQIASADSPLDLSALDAPEAQSIGPDIVSDFDAILIADPFLLQRGDRIWLFFEAVERASRKGVISAAWSTNGIDWTYHGKVLEEKFHISYPQVFEHNGEFWMIPETARDLSVRLYRARNFPDDWEFESVLLKGHHFCDSTLLRHQEKWWMFASDRHNVLNLYYADELTGPWHQHPASPIVHRSSKNARCGGRILSSSGRLLRISQDCELRYGHFLRAYEILEFDDDKYREVEIETSPILVPKTGTWRPFGCHHLDVLEHNGRWIIASDGY